MYVPAVVFGLVISMLALPAHSWPIAEQAHLTKPLQHKTLLVFHFPPDLNVKKLLTWAQRKVLVKKQTDSPSSNDPQAQSQSQPFPSPQSSQNDDPMTRQLYLDLTGTESPPELYPPKPVSPDIPLEVPSNLELEPQSKPPSKPQSEQQSKPQPESQSEPDPQIPPQPEPHQPQSTPQSEP